MQNKIGKGGIVQIVEGIKAIATSSRTVVLFSLISLSCAFLPQKIQIQDSLLDSLDRICLSGEGKGKVVLDEKPYSFGFESLLDIPEKKWIVAMNVLFHGEEKMVFYWNENGVDPVGRFFEIKGDKRQIISQFHPLGRFLWFYGHGRELWGKKCGDLKKKQGICRWRSVKFSWEIQDEEFKVIFPDEGWMLVFGRRERHFEKMNLRSPNNSLDLSLFFSRCH